jgi:diadenosine tetraphosphate (Ap4A) HIT family hydrolase
MGNKQTHCKFCEIINTNDKNTIIYEDEQFVMFYDIKPCAEIHILAVPKEHIINCNYLTKDHLELLNHMKTQILLYFNENFDGDKNVLLGFHIPPCVMISHLHLHCIVPPFKNKVSRFVLFGAFFRSIYAQIDKLK